MNKRHRDFIPANESALFITVFDWYVRNLFWRRFKSVKLLQAYEPSSVSKTIYYINHSSWWDGLIPFLLNQKILKQNARAIMEDKQMRRHTFFSKIGAFSVNLDDPRKSIKSLRYAVQSMERDKASLFIYPEGEIVPFSTEVPNFKKGLGWLSKQCPNVDVVPVGVYIHTSYSDKPELAISIGEPVTEDRTQPADRLNDLYASRLQNILANLVNSVHEDQKNFIRI